MRRSLLRRLRGCKVPCDALQGCAVSLLKGAGRAPLPLLIRLNPAADRSYFHLTALNEEP
jgi:hypothetical protein